MIYFLYNLAALAGAPLGAMWLALRPGHKALLQRFAPRIPELPDGPVWVHACSVGELGTARPLIAAMRERWPSLPVLLTTSTLAGRALCECAGEEFHVTWCPFDVLPCIRRFLRLVRPRLLVLIETEMWPNMLREARRNGVAVVVVNGRLSDKHYPRYRRWRRIVRAAFGELSAVGAQNEEYAQRFAALGVNPALIQVTGSMKFDRTPPRPSPSERAELRRANGLALEEPVLMFGSTRPGDEDLAIRCWRGLREALPELRLIIGPRHLDRLHEVAAALSGESFVRRSEIRQGRCPAGERVLVLDTMGEQASFFALADIAVIGGSFFPGVNGHNPLESAALGVPTVFGPYMRNFVDAARVLLEAAGACQVASPDELPGLLHRLLANSGERERIGASGWRAVAVNRGATQRSLDLLAPFLS